jgi:hypothetical protein
VHLGPWTLHPLNSPVELWDEAVAMRHCAERCEPECRAGDTVMFSVIAEDWPRVRDGLADRVSAYGEGA